jgi:hypothetical protein
VVKIQNNFQCHRKIPFWFHHSLGIGILSMALTGCSIFEGSLKRSAREDAPIQNSMHQQKSNVGSGFSETSELSEIKTQIRILEKRLETRKEKEQYSKILPWFSDETEKIDFLKQPNLEAKNRWLLKQKILLRPKSLSAETKSLIDNQDIALGMPSDFVKKSWGEPTAKEVSGNPLNRNERWRYVRSISSSEGFRQEKRYVYFEGGKVVGWETE